MRLYLVTQRYYTRGGTLVGNRPIGCVIAADTTAALVFVPKNLRPDNAWFSDPPAMEDLGEVWGVGPTGAAWFPSKDAPPARND